MLVVAIAADIIVSYPAPISIIESGAAAITRSIFFAIAMAIQTFALWAHHTIKTVDSLLPTTQTSDLRTYFKLEF